jgi:hypothetical protein
MARRTRARRRSVAVRARPDIEGRTRRAGTAAGRASYIELALATEDGLSRSISLLRTFMDTEANADETRHLRAEIAEQEATLAKVHADLLAFLAERTVIVSPTAADVREALALSRELDAIVVSSMRARDVLAAATRLAEVWGRTRVPPSGGARRGPVGRAKRSSARRGGSRRRRRRSSNGARRRRMSS